jgi:hypothetical protein
MPTRGLDPTRSATSAALLAALLPACAPTSLYRTAEPVPRGEWHLTAAAGGGGLSDRDQATKTGIGHAEVGLRRGLTHDLDLGARVFVPGLELNATWRLAHRDGWSLALAPQVAIVRTPPSTTLTNAAQLLTSLAVPVTRRWSNEWAFTLGPTIGHGVYWPETGGSAHGVRLGGVMSVQWRSSPRWWWLAELDAQRTVSGEVPTTGGAVLLGVGARFRL